MIPVNPSVLLAMTVLALGGFISFCRWLLTPSRATLPDDPWLQVRETLKQAQPLPDGSWQKATLAWKPCDAPAQANQAEIKIGDRDARPIPHRS